MDQMRRIRRLVKEKLGPVKVFWLGADIVQILKNPCG